MVEAPNFMLSEAEFKLVRDVVYKHCGIALSDEKISLVRARITKQMRNGGFSTVAEYLSHVLKDRNDSAFTGFIDSISTNLTSFFRENQHFEYLSNIVLPRLFAQKQQTGETRIVGWSAACSSGEEPYTLAMTLMEAINRRGGSTRWDVRLLATDISTAMLAYAGKGIYPAARVATVPDGIRKKYLSPVQDREHGESFEISPEMRQMVRLRHLNLMDAWPFKGPFDFIFCRNVMIYFDKATQQKLVDRFWSCLRPGGLLFTGHSESLTGVAHRFSHRQASIYEKTGE